MPAASVGFFVWCKTCRTTGDVDGRKCQNCFGSGIWMRHGHSDQDIVGELSAHGEVLAREPNPYRKQEAD